MSRLDSYGAILDRTYYLDTSKEEEYHFYRGKMEMKRRINTQKAVEALLYVIPKIRKQDMYTALKVLYFADRFHLERYGSQIYGESFVAMKNGPVPSFAYDLVKSARGDGYPLPYIQDTLAVENKYTLHALREPNFELLSQSNIECLDEAIEKFGQLPFNDLMNASHDEAFKSADRNDYISLENLVKSLPDGEILLDYLQS